MRTRKPARRTILRLQSLEDRSVPSFGTGGVVTTHLPYPDAWTIRAVAPQLDGKIVAAGTAAVARYNPDGSLDTTFNPGGVLPGTIQAAGKLDDMILQPDGKIVAGGEATVNGQTDFLVQRFNPDGTPDATFGKNGVVTTGFTKGGGVKDDLRALTLQADGKVVAVGKVNIDKPGGGWAVVRYQPNGTLDPTFDGDGWVVTQFGPKNSIAGDAYAVAIQSDGKIVVTGEGRAGAATGADFTAVRYNPNGSLDSGFGSGGKVTIDFGSELLAPSTDDHSRDLSLLPGGQILLVGTASGGGTGGQAFARLNANGSLDTTFGGNGLVCLTDGGPAVTEIVVQPDGKIVGESEGYGSPICRFNPDGSRDTAFNGTGSRYFRYSDSGTPNFSAVAILPDGRILVAGGETVQPDQANWGLGMLTPDGALDA